jgi:hypothetical protein
VRPKRPAEEEDNERPPWYPFSKHQLEEGICPPYTLLECQPPGGHLGTTTEGGVSTRDWPMMEGPEVRREPLRVGRGQGVGKTSLSGLGQRSWDGGDVAGGSGGPKDNPKNPKLPMVDMPRGGDKPAWGGGAKWRDRYALNMGDKLPVGGGRPEKEEAKDGTKSAQPLAWGMPPPGQPFNSCAPHRGGGREKVPQRLQPREASHRHQTLSLGHIPHGLPAKTYPSCKERSGGRTMG